MRDVELYRHLRGLEEPWTVRSVELKVAEQRVDVWAGHVEGVRWPCRECGPELALYDHAEERVWRHLDSCQFLTYLHAPPPRVECPTHGVRQSGGPGQTPGRASRASLSGWPSHRERFAQLKATTLKAGRAWALEERLRELWHYTRVGWAERHWKRWYFWATHSRLTPVIGTARLIQRHLPNVLTFFSDLRTPLSGG